MREALTSWKDAHVDQGSDGVPDHDRETVNEGGVASVSDCDDESDDGEYYDSESNRLEQIDSEDEFMDAEFEELVSLEGPQEMMGLML